MGKEERSKEGRDGGGERSGQGTFEGRRDGAKEAEMGTGQRGIKGGEEGYTLIDKWRAEK